jgi:peroxiredoxin
MIKRLLKSKRTDKDSPDPQAPGAEAPNFRLQSETGEWLTLDELRGRPVVLVFYPADNSPVCSSQLALYSEAHSMFEAYDAQLLGISVDGTASHRDFARDLKLKFPLLSDDKPPGDLARAYGVFNESKGICERALFVLDDQGVVRWSHVSPPSVNPGANGILEALESLDKPA